MFLDKLSLSIYNTLMKEIRIIAPVKKPEDIETFSAVTDCRAYYVYYKKFLNNNFEYVLDFVNSAKKNNCSIYINFKHDINEENLPEIKKMLKFLKTSGIDGIFINSYAILEAIKLFNLPFKVIVDSYFDIHNLSGIDFINNFHKVDEVIITEEIYLKNIEKIKKYTKLPLAIDTDNLPYCAEDIEKSGAIDSVVIKGKYDLPADCPFLRIHLKIHIIVVQISCREQNVAPFLRPRRNGRNR